MQLSGPLFAQIVAALHAPGAGAPARGAATSVEATEQRREPRVGVQARVTLIPLTADATLAPGPLAVTLRDFSAGGIRFAHAAPVDLDEQFVVLLPHDAGSESVAVLCQVAYYQPQAEHEYAVGARFLRVLRQPVAVDAALALPSQQHSASRRVAS